MALRSFGKVFVSGLVEGVEILLLWTFGMLDMSSGDTLYELYPYYL